MIEDPSPEELRHVATAALTASLAASQAPHATAQADATKIVMLPVCQPFQLNVIKHFHAGREIFLQLEGDGALIYEEGKQALRPGGIVVVPRGVAHDEETYAHPYRNLVFTCADNRLHFHLGVEESLPGLGRVRTRVSLQDDRAGRVVAHLNEASAYRADERSDDHPLVAGLLQTAIALVREIVVEAQSPVTSDPLVEQARHLILTHMTNPLLTVGWMAMRLDCNADYLSHRFHQITGSTISNSVTSHRLSFACRRLQESTEAIGSIARSAGFRDPAYFSRIFRDQLGQSPRAWRRAQAGK